jgi:hypothetical protein
MPSLISGASGPLNAQGVAVCVCKKAGGYGTMIFFSIVALAFISVGQTTHVCDSLVGCRD